MKTLRIILFVTFNIWFWSCLVTNSFFFNGNLFSKIMTIILGVMLDIFFIVDQKSKYGSIFPEEKPTPKKSDDYLDRF